MTTVNMHEAKTNLSKLVEAVESGQETEVIIARNGRPVARIVPLAEPARQGRRFGLLKGLYAFPDTIDARNEEIAELFEGSKS